MRQENSARSEGFHTTSTHRHVLNLRILAQDLNVPQLGEVEISLLLQAVNKELQLSYLQTMAFTQVVIILEIEKKLGKTFTQTD